MYINIKYSCDITLSHLVTAVNSICPGDICDAVYNNTD